jgi:hypothetical protein
MKVGRLRNLLVVLENPSIKSQLSSCGLEKCPDARLLLDIHRVERPCRLSKLHHVARS